MARSTFVLVNRRLNTPGVVVAGNKDQVHHRVELFFRSVDVAGYNEDIVRTVRITQESTGLGVNLSLHERFCFTLSPNDALWAAASHDVVCWQVWD